MTSGDPAPGGLRSDGADGGRRSTAEAAPRETELKLDVDPAAAARLRATLDQLYGAGETKVLRSTYYDTAAEDLRAHGVTLRVRTGAGPSLQTVKQAGTAQAGLFDRDEWETCLADDQPDLAAFAANPAVAAMSIDVGSLAPVFETVIERTTWQAESSQGHIELALDSGSVAAQGRTEMFTELELELKRGAPHHLFTLMTRLGEGGDLRPGVLTKSERGYALRDGRRQRCIKAEPLDVKKSMDVATAFRVVVHGCMRHFWLNEPLLVATRAPEALHQSRVALRRLRSALSLFRPVVADQEFERLRTELKAVAQHLGEARNLDVYLRSVAGPVAAESPAGTGGEPFVAAIETQRDAAYDEVLGRLRSGEFRRLMLDLLAWAEAGPWQSDDDPRRKARRVAPIRSYAAALLDKRRRRVKRQGRHLASLDPADRHRVRIEAKKLRYATEFFAGLTTGDKARHRHVAFLDALEHVQDQLGALNDIATGQEIAERFAQHQTGTGAGLLAALQARATQGEGEEALLAKAEDAHSRFANAKRFWSRWKR